MSKEAESAMIRPMEPPAEPKVLYPDSQLDAEDGLAIIRGTTFFVATRRGDLMPPGAPQVGLFCDDTRFLSRLELRVNGQEPIVLSSTTMGADMARVELTVQGGSVSGENLDLPINTIYVHREQLLDRNRLYDILDIENFHHATVVLNVELFFVCPRRQLLPASSCKKHEAFLLLRNCGSGRSGAGSCRWKHIKSEKPLFCTVARVLPSVGETATPA